MCNAFSIFTIPATFVLYRYAIKSLMLVVHHARTIKIVINVWKAREDLSLIRIKPRFADKNVILFKYSFQT
jgi:hypothetical protein